MGVGISLHTILASSGSLITMKRTMSRLQPHGAALPASRIFSIISSGTFLPITQSRIEQRSHINLCTTAISWLVKGAGRGSSISIFSPARSFSASARYFLPHSKSGASSEKPLSFQISRINCGCSPNPGDSFFLPRRIGRISTSIV
ncbi:hypothetical protein ES703_38262 [subsurface metagenome]